MQQTQDEYEYRRQLGDILIRFKGVYAKFGDLHKGSHGSNSEPDPAWKLSVRDILVELQVIAEDMLNSSTPSPKYVTHDKHIKMAGSEIKQMVKNYISVIDNSVSMIDMVTILKENLTDINAYIVDGLTELNKLDNE